MIEAPTRNLLGAAGIAPVVLDSATGTRLIARGLSLEHDDPCLWNLTHPEAVAEAHELDLSAGSDAVLTNTFGANRAWLARFGLADEVDAVTRRAVEIARGAAGPLRFVIGSIGPTAAANPVNYREQAEALAGAGVDALAFETHRLDQALVALKWVRPVLSIPLIVSLVTWPEPAEDAVRALEDLGTSAIGCNCRPGLNEAIKTAGRLRLLTGLPIWVKPSAGLPGGPQEGPEEFARAVPTLLGAGVRFLGGCCGTTEAHVAAIRAACYAVRGRTT